MATVDVFVCVRRQNARLSILACARDFQAAKRGPQRYSGGGFTADWSRVQHCEGCTTGLEHVTGKKPARWPDGEPIERREIGRDHDPDAAAPVAVVPAPILPGDRRRLPVIGAPIPTMRNLPTGAPRGADERRAAISAPPVAESSEPPPPAVKEETVPFNRDAGPRRITYKSKTQTIQEWADEIGITPNALRLRLGKMSEAEALSTPPGGSNPTGMPKPKGSKKSKAPRSLPSKNDGEPVASPRSGVAAFAVELLRKAGVAFTHETAPSGITLIFIPPA